jgi:hypothetical protein
VCNSIVRHRNNFSNTQEKLEEISNLFEPRYFFFVYYYNPYGPKESDIPDIVQHKEQKVLHWLLFCIYVVVVILMFLVGYVIILITGPYSSAMMLYAYIMGIIGVIAVVIQYLPQIYQIYKLKVRIIIINLTKKINSLVTKTSGNLSLVALMMQAPGTWIWAFFMIFGEPQNWSTWSSSLVSSIEMTIILFQVIYYDHLLRYLQRKAKQDAVGIELEACELDPNPDIPGEDK